ncbi:hypothetical protein [Clostridium sporogenes]|uniref:hypothetical protein n=1 Tax=Clostridium sporogenes TaxID=1509 RepID=UPI0005EE9F9F|nr:hypothetical protein [Clostridium sporogenes]
MKNINIEEVLKEYRGKKSIVETTLARIEAYRYALAHPEIIAENYYNVNTKEPGMPGAPLRNTSSPIERGIEIKELTEEAIKEWIEEDESRIFFYQLEVEQIEKALQGLTHQEKYIVELKYFDSMFWREIERNFNDKFRQNNYITTSGLRKMTNRALAKLKETLAPFYNRYTRL